MVCPYRNIVIYTEPKGSRDAFAKAKSDYVITEETKFAECQKEACPFYLEREWDWPTCLRADRETQTDRVKKEWRIKEE